MAHEGMTQEAPWDLARTHAARAVQQIASEVVSLSRCVGRTLAKDALALCDLPMYATSAMDGYAVAGAGPWKIIGDVKAGAPMHEVLADGTAVRIATGAVIPQGTLGIIRWEVAQISEQVLKAEVEAGEDIRPAGMECKEGEILALCGTLLSSQWIGLLASAGIDEVRVTRTARVAIVLLGDEIQLSGIPRDGLVRDALGPQLPGWLHSMGAEVISSDYVPDELSLVVKALKEKIEKCDLLITTGGTADGPRDHLHSAIRELHGSLVVDKVKVRPGHPMLLATLPRGNGEQVPLLGLPGNPQSAIVALMTLGEPLINTLLGRAQRTLDEVEIDSDINVPPDFTRLVTGNISNGHFHPGEHLGSAMLRGVANSSGFAVVTSQGCQAGSLVRWLPFP